MRLELLLYLEAKRGSIFDLASKPNGRAAHWHPTCRSGGS